MLREPNPKIVEAARNEFMEQLRSKEKYKNIDNGYDMAIALVYDACIKSEIIGVKKFLEGGFPTHGLFTDMLKVIGICVLRGDYCPKVYKNLLIELFDCECFRENELQTQ